MKLTLHIILGGAAMLALVITLAFGRQSPAPVAAVAQVEQQSTPKTDSLHRELAMEALRSAMIATAEAKKVQTETIRPEPTIIPPIVQVQEEPEPKPRRRIKATSPKRSDVCQRHGQRKVMVGKYRWRCKK